MDDLRLVWAGEDPKGYTPHDISNKGIGLLELFLAQGEGFEVPNFFITPTSFWRDYAKRRELYNKIQVSSLDDINTLLKNQTHVLGQSNAPDQIRSLFRDFISDYSGILVPAYSKLTGFADYSEFHRAYRQKYKPFFKAVKRSMPIEKYRAIRESFLRADSSMVVTERKLEQLRQAISYTLYRSASPLEDGQLPFSGVFNSISDMGFKELNELALATVLSSSYFPYAQFYMEQNGVIDRNREMAVIFHNEVRKGLFEEPTFFGDVQILGKDRAIVRYSPNLPGYSVFYVVIDHGEIVRYDGKDKKKRVERRTPGQGPFSDPFDHPGFEEVLLDKLPDSGLLDTVAVGRNTAKRLGTSGCIFEFAVRNGERYFFQKKPISQEILSRYSHLERSLPTVDESRVITRNVYGYTVGNSRGPFINLAKHGNPRNWRDTDFGKLTLDDIDEIDRLNPGAIYFVDPFQFFSKFPRSSKVDKDKRGEEAGKVFHMATPRKSGVIVYNTDASWCHMDTIYEYGRVASCLIERDPTNPIHNLKDGTEIAIASSGRECVIYRP